MCRGLPSALRRNSLHIGRHQTISPLHSLVAYRLPIIQCMMLHLDEGKLLFLQPYHPPTTLSTHLRLNE